MERSLEDSPSLFSPSSSPFSFPEPSLSTAAMEPETWCGDNQANELLKSTGEGGEEEVEEGPCIIKGYLWKRSMYMKRWNKRWFELRQGVLKYKANEKSPSYRGVIPVSQWQSVGLLPELRSRPKWTGFYLHTSEDSFALASETLDGAQHWVSELVTMFREKSSNSDETQKKEKKESDAVNGLSSPQVPPMPQEIKQQRSARKSRASFSFSPSFFSQRVRSQSLIETKEESAAEENCQLMSGMMQDIVKKKDIRIKDLEKELLQARERVEELEVELQDEQGKVSGSNTEVEELKTEIDLLSSSMRVVQSQNEDLQNQNDELLDQNKKLDAENKDIQLKLDLADNELVKMEEKLLLATEEGEFVKKQMDLIKEENSKLQEKLEEVEGSLLRPFWG